MDSGTESIRHLLSSERGVKAVKTLALVLIYLLALAAIAGIMHSQGVIIRW